MRLLLALFLFLFAFFLCAQAQQVVLSDNFEGGLGLWQTYFWNVTDSFSVSPTHSFTDSDTTLYFSNTYITAEMAVGANLTGYLGATLQFQAKYWIEPNFDFCRVQVSRDGIFWVLITSITGISSNWQFLSYDIGAFAGLPNVRVRFAMQTDPQTNYDGIYIDDLAILGWPEDQSGPLIIHRGPEGYQGVPHDYRAEAEIWDASGISDEYLMYRVDGGDFRSAMLDSIIGENYYHTIPTQPAGSLVEYYFSATDASPGLHTSISDTFAYVAGQMLIQDDGYPEEVLVTASGDLAAVGFRAQNGGYVTSVLLSFYTDMFHPLDSVAVYVWADSAGFPDSVLAGPFIIFPASDPTDPEIWTWLDLRPAMIPAPDTFYVGLEFGLTGGDYMSLSSDDSAVFNHSYLNIGSGFQPYDDGDLYIRCVVGDIVSGIETGGNNALPARPTISLFPNPTNGAFRLNWNGGQIRSVSELLLYDLAGRQIKRWLIEPPWESSAVSIQLPDGLAGGIYLLEVGFEGGLRPERLKLIYLP
ncbi:MAG TPA: hypothetical protein VF398_03585 [bacterium]|jgi:hypothetical protein